MAETPSVIERQKIVRLLAKDSKQDEHCCGLHYRADRLGGRVSCFAPLWTPQNVPQICLSDVTLLKALKTARFSRTISSSARRPTRAPIFAFGTVIHHQSADSAQPSASIQVLHLKLLE
jgi:hypothetical protein